MALYFKMRTVRAFVIVSFDMSLYMLGKPFFGSRQLSVAEAVDDQNW